MAVQLRAGIPGRWEGARCRQLRITRPEDDLPFLPECQDLMLDFCNTPEPCPVRARCLLFALVNNYSKGVWGGMGPEDRVALRKKFPLGAGQRTGSGITYDLPPQWEWMPPGAAQLLPSPRHRRRTETEKNGNDDSKTSRADERPG